MGQQFSLLKKQNKIGKRLMALIIAFSSLITLVITAFQLFMDYREQRNDLDITLNGVVVNVPTITGSVWAFDEEQIHLQLEALVNLRNIEHARIVTNTKKNEWEKGLASSKHVVVRGYPLVYTKRGKEQTIGELTVVASLDAIYERVAAKALGILVSNGVKTFFVALFMFAIFYKYVARRIEALAEKVETLTNELTESEINGLYVSNPEHDEIQAVQSSFDHMAVKLRSTMKDLKSSNRSLQHAYDEVQTINSELELRVHERTQHLQQEIVEREFVQESLKHSEQRLRDIAESASDWFWEMDPDFLFSYVSGRCYEVTGLTPEQVIGKSRIDMVQLEDTASDKWEDYKEILTNRLPLENFTYKYTAPNGREMYIELSGKPVFDAASNFLGYRGAARDTTDQVIYQEKLQKAIDLADKANKAKSEFISSMSHELRTPLNGILGFAQLLEMNKKKPLDQQQADYVHQIRNAGNLLLRLINEILDLAKVEAGKVQLSMEPISPLFIIQDNLDILEALAGKYNVTISMEYSEVEPELQISADQTRFSQLIMNLCSNAIKYNQEGGSVKICLSKNDEQWLRVSVEDTGLGMTDEQITQLFTPFNRLDAEGSKTEGTGVGLSITRKLVHLMGGKIGVESEPGVGSKFWFEFKILSEGDRQANSTHIPFSGKLPNQLMPCRVLYVEDNADNMKLVKEVFENFEGTKLYGADTAEQGIELALNTEVDLILMDLNLPGMSGSEALKELRRHKAMDGIPIIALSANAHPDTIARCKNEGFNNFLTKPLDIPTLIHVVNILLTH